MEDLNKNPQESEVNPEHSEALLPEMSALDPGSRFFSKAGDFGSDSPEVVDVTEEIEDVEIPEVVDIPENVDIPEEVVIPEPAAIPPVEESAPAPEPAVLGPTYEEPYIPLEMIQEAEAVPKTPETLPARNPDDTQFYLPQTEFEEYASPAVDAAFLDQSEDAPEFAAMLGETPQPAPAGSRERRPARKGRPARRKGDGFFGLPHLAATLVWLLLIVLIGVTLGKTIWVFAADVLAFGRENKPVTVTIVETDTLDTITDKLHEAGLVQYPGLFKIYARLTNAEAEITTGAFLLNTNYDYHALVNGLSPSSSSRTVVEVLIPEGYNSRQIYDLLAANSVCSVEALEAYAASGEFKDFWFLEDVERGDKYCLEGFLFPDTYEFYVGSTPREALGKMLTGFENRVPQEMMDDLPALNQRLSAMMRANGCSEEYIAEHQIGIRELVIVASLIEEESAAPAESPNIASVIYNRLTQDQVYERYLNIDAAIFYALGYHKEALTEEDLKIDSPYNTYTHAGLTPTPITNPGLASIQAALDPADTKYYYYVLNPATEMHQFSKTYEEHQKLVEKYKEAE